MAKKLAQTFTRAQFDSELEAIARKTAESLVTMGKKVYDILTEDERADLALFETTGEQFPPRLIKVMLLAFGDEVIDREWNAETIKPLVSKIKRIRNKRYY